MEYTSLAQAIGDEPTGSPAFAAEDDFDPADPAEVEVVQLATEGHRTDRITALQREVDGLRAQLGPDREGTT